jgi:hypothetical protein
LRPARAKGGVDLLKCADITVPVGFQYLDHGADFQPADGAMGR